MKYKASLDVMAKVITTVICILFAVVIYRSIQAMIDSQGDLSAILINSLISVFLLVVIIICYIYSPASYTVDRSGLSINRPVGNVHVDIKDIVKFRTLTDNDMVGMIRTFGVGGLFGYFGKFYNASIGPVTLYATQRKNRILIHTRQGKSLIITPDDLTLVDRLRQDN